MSQTRAQLKTIIRTNLDDAGVTFYQEDDLNDSLQDAYDDIVALSQAIVKTVTLTWPANVSYLDFINDFSVTDYLATVAIFNNLTNRWLRDDLTLRNFDQLRRDWECWIGTPQFWTPSDFKRIAIAPKYSVATNDFKLVYWAIAPTIASDGETYLIASDVNNLLEFYATADLLEQQEEFSKATDWWGKYYNSLQEYSSRVKRNNKSDLVLRV